MPSVALPPPAEPAAVEVRAADSPSKYGDREDLSDFRPGDFELKLRLGLVGFEAAPWTLLSSLIGWQEIQLCADGGLLSLGDATIGLGLETWWARPFLLEALYGSVYNWKSADRGVAGRASLHLTSLSSVDPYVVLLAGPTWYTFEASMIDATGPDASSASGTSGLRTGIGGGLSAVAPNRLLGGVELRYLASIRYEGLSTLTLTDDVGQILVVDVRRRHRGPNGFGWVLYIGVRF